MQDYELREIYKEVTQMVRETSNNDTLRSNNDIIKTSCFIKTLLKIVIIGAITIVLICAIFAGCFIYITHQQYNYSGYPTTETNIGGDYNGNETTKADSNTATAKDP